jgi:hypothetical protein
MDEFETLLREFKPRRPGPLPRRPKARPALWLLAAAAAAAALLAVVAQDFSPARRAVVERDFLVRRSPAEGGSSAVSRNEVQGFSPARDFAPTIGSLTPLALSDPAAFDAALTRLSQTLLPDVEQPDRALSALGRESK